MADEEARHRVALIVKHRLLRVLVLRRVHHYHAHEEAPQPVLLLVGCWALLRACKELEDWCVGYDEDVCADRAAMPAKFWLVALIAVATADGNSGIVVVGGVGVGE